MLSKTASTILKLMDRSVYRPFLWWIVISAVLLTLCHHQKRERDASIRFVVTLEGRKEAPSYRAELNGTPYESGDRSGLGKKTIMISADDGEPFVTNVFVWY